MRKHIRNEKARIRRQVLDLDQQKKLIAELTQKYSNRNEGNGNIQPSAK
jgi:hypothetical protein